MARSSLDAFASVGVSIGEAQLNVAGLMGLATLLFGGLVRLFHRRRRAPFGVGGRIGKAWLLIVSAALVGTITGWATNGSTGFFLGAKETIRLLSVYAVFYLAYVFSDSPARVRVLIRILFVSLAAPGIVAVYQLVTGSSHYVVNGILRVYGTFAQPGSFARYLSLFIILGTALILSPRQKVIRVSLLLLLLPGLFALLVLSYSRGSLILCVLSIVVLAVRNFGRGLPVLAGVGILLGVVFGDQLARRYSDLRIGYEVVEAVQEGSTTNSFEWRLLNWEGLLQAGAESMWFGHGTMSASSVNPLKTWTAHGELVGFSAHSELVRAFVEGGLPSVAALVAAVLVLLHGLVVAQRRIPPGDPARTVASASVATFAAFGVAGVLVVEFLSSTAALYVFMAWAGMVQRRAAESEIRPDGNG
jgi:O-antigen ligase